MYICIYAYIYIYMHIYAIVYAHNMFIVVVGVPSEVCHGVSEGSALSALSQTCFLQTNHPRLSMLKVTPAMATPAMARFQPPERSQRCLTDAAPGSEGVIIHMIISISSMIAIIIVIIIIIMISSSSSSRSSIICRPGPGGFWKPESQAPAV